MFAHRSQPIVLVTMLLFVVMFTPGPARGALPRFEYHKIAEVGREMGQTSLVDIDKDGDLDWVVGERTRTWWFEYVGPDQWIQHNLGEGAQTDVGGTAFDIVTKPWSGNLHIYLRNMLTEDKKASSP